MGFAKQQDKIALYMRLTRKNVDSLSGRSFGTKFQPTFDAFCASYARSETEFRKGISDHQRWAETLRTLAADLHRTAHYITA